MASLLSFNVPNSPRVVFGAGRLNELHTLPMPGQKALIVISKGKSTRANGYLDRLENELRQSGCAYVIFDRIQANPLKETVEEGAEWAKSENCDFIIALGGGSVMDSAKVMAMKATNEGDLWDYVMSGTGKRMTPIHAPLPWIAIPTTAGTGSEVDAGGVITNLKTKEKLGIFSSFATYAIIDPELQTTVPPEYTVFQGFDALYQLLEGCLCKSANLYSDMLQETGIRHIVENLPIAYRDGKNVEARAKMAFATMLSGTSMVVSTCTAEHSIEHALSAYHESLPHGAGLIMISKAYYNAILRQHVADDRLIRMAKYMGKEDAACPEDFISALLDFQKIFGVDELKMSDYGIVPEEFDAMASNAMTVMARLYTQDIQPLTHEEIVRILQESYR